MEFKFKMWDKRDKEMSQHDEIIVLPSEDTLDSIFKTDRYLFLLYSGLKDENGNEIYDGCIHSEKVEVDGEMIDSTLPVVFENGAFWLDESYAKDKSLLKLLCEYNDAPLNIVGNIYENPKLLTQHLNHDT